MLNTGTTATPLQCINTVLTQPTKRDMHTPTLNRQNAAFVKAQVCVEAVAVQEKTIGQNRTLSDEGKAAQLALMMEDRLPSFAFLKTLIADVEAIQARYETQFFTVPSPVPTNEVKEFLLLQYVCDRVGDEPQARRAAFFAAADANNALVLWAVLNDPMGSMVDEPDTTRALTERAKRLWPTEYDSYEQTLLLVAELRPLREWIARMARTLGASPAKIAATLGLPVGLNGAPGQPRLEGKVWSQALASQPAADGVRRPAGSIAVELPVTSSVSA